MRVNLSIFVFLSILILTGCELPRDKIVEYNSNTSIGGFTSPRKVRIHNDSLYVIDSGVGIYSINMVNYDLSKDTSVSDSQIIYNRDESGDVVDFDFKGETMYSIIYNSPNYYIMKFDLSSKSKSFFTVPDKLPASRVKISGDNLFFVGNMNMSLGVKMMSNLVDYKFDTSTDFIYLSATSYPGNFVVAETTSDTYIYISSKHSSEIGIETYRLRDATVDVIDKDLFSQLNKYPFNLSISDNYLLCSTHSEIIVYDISDRELPLKTSSIKIGNDLGVYKSITYGSKIVALYGYEMKVSSTDNYSYDTTAYWSGVKVISDPYTANPKIEKDILIEGWAIDAEIYNGYILSGNQALGIITINKL